MKSLPYDVKNSAITFYMRACRSEQRLPLAARAAGWPAFHCRSASPPSGRRRPPCRCPDPPESSETRRQGCLLRLRRRQTRHGTPQRLRCPSNIRTEGLSGDPGPVATSAS